MLLTLGALGDGGVADIQGLPQYQHITVGSLWVGEVDLLQDNHGVPDVSVE